MSFSEAFLNFISRDYEWAPMVAFIFISYLFLSRRSFVGSVIFVFCALIWLKFSASIFQALHLLGVESLYESTSFDMNEAFFYLRTTLNVIFRNRLSQEKFFVLLMIYLGGSAVGLILFSVLKKWSKFFARHQNLIILVVAGLLLTLSMARNTLSIALAWHDSLTLPKTIRSNFSASGFDLGQYQNKDIRNLSLVTYIGESTSSMHMGIYNYWRNTTPQLDLMKSSNLGLLVVDNVFSTHTHTSLSLLEVLSVSANESSGEKIVPVFDQTRISLIDILAAAGIKTTLATNQGINGTWNLSSDGKKLTLDAGTIDEMVIDIISLTSSTANLTFSEQILEDLDDDPLTPDVPIDVEINMTLIK